MSPLAGAALFGVLVVLIVVGFLVFVTYNAVVALQQRMAKAWANIDVVLKQRYDELPNLVEAVKDLMAYEQETLTRVTALRAAYSPTEPIPAQASTSEATSAAVRQLFAVVERYPAIHSQENVLALQAEIERLEGMIADRRELYNDTVYHYNTRIAQSPTNVIAWVFGWAPRPFFRATDEESGRPAVDLATGG
jgi:LemA protein